MEEENSTKAVASLRRCGHILYHHIGEKRGQTRVLELLTEKKTLPQQQILEQLGVQPGSGSELLSKLEGRGLIERVRDEADNRRVLVHLTAQGRAEFDGKKEEPSDETLMEPLEELRDFWEDAAAWGELPAELFTPLIKTVGIALLSRTGSDLCRDAGEGAIASVLETAGAVAAIAVSLPLFRAAWELLRSLL